MDRNFATLFELNQARFEADTINKAINSALVEYAKLESDRLLILKQIKDLEIKHNVVEAKIKGVSTREELQLVLNALESASIAEAGALEVAADALRATLRAESDSDHYVRKSWLQASVF